MGRIKGSWIRDLRNGLRCEHPCCRECKETGHIYRRIFMLGDGATGSRQDTPCGKRIDDGHVVLAGLYMEYLPLARVEKLGAAEFSYGGDLHFDKNIKRFKGWK